MSPLGGITIEQFVSFSAIMLRLGCCLLTILSVLHLCFCENTPESAPIVRLDGSGQVRGTVQRVREQTVYLYQGIPYGQAKRFEKPERVNSWNGVYNATSYRFACPQPSIAIANSPASVSNQSFNLSETEWASEDCLFLNVWSVAPNQSDSSPRAVLVWIHGGGNYMSGTIFSQTYNASYIVALGNVIVVTVNYRLGPFGFLYGDDGDEPGNLGIYDQILALKWVRRNIDRFGGDPKQVTIFGEGSGASCVSILVLSPKTDNLFQRAILQSQSAISNKGAEHKDLAFARTRMFASLLDCNERSKSELMKCIRSKSVESIVNASIALQQIGQEMIPVYGEDLLPRSPVQTLLRGRLNNKQIDLLFGVNLNISLPKLLLDMMPALNSSSSSLSLADVRSCIHCLMRFDQVPFLTEVTSFYTDSVDASNQTQLRDALTNAYSDFSYVCPTILFGQQYAEQQPSNKYFSYRLTETSSCSSEAVLCHFTEAVYLFGERIAQNVSHQDVQLSEDIIQAWTNFARTGSPGQIGSVQWVSAFGGDNNFTTRFMSLQAGNYRMADDAFYGQSCDQFWKPKLFSLYRFGSDD